MCHSVLLRRSRKPQGSRPSSLLAALPPPTVVQSPPTCTLSLPFLSGNDSQAPVTRQGIPSQLGYHSQSRGPDALRCLLPSTIGCRWHTVSAILSFSPLVRWILSSGIADDEKRRREGYSASTLARRSDAETDDVTPTTPDEPTPTSPNEPTPTSPNEPTPTSLDEPTLTAPNEPTPTTPNESTPVTLNEPTPTMQNEDSASDVSPDPPQTPELPSPGQTSPTTSPTPPPVTLGGTTAMANLTPHTVSLPPTPETRSRPFERDQSHPDFITPAIIEHLNSVDGGSRWVDTVKSYLRLEGQYPSRVSSRPP